MFLVVKALMRYSLHIQNLEWGKHQVDGVVHICSTLRIDKLVRGVRTHIVLITFCWAHIYPSLTKHDLVKKHAKYQNIQWGKKVFSQPPIVQVLPLKKMREACNFHHRYTSTMRDKIRKKNPENHIVGFLKNLFANYGGK